MKDFRCKECNRLLAKVEGNSRLEIKCPRCKTMNFHSREIYITIEEKPLGGARGKEDPCIDPEVAES